MKIDPQGNFDFKYKKHFVLKTLFTQFMLEKGFLASNRFYTSYAHQNQYIEKYFGSVGVTFDLISKAIKEGTPAKYLKGQCLPFWIQEIDVSLMNIL